MDVYRVEGCTRYKIEKNIRDPALIRALYSNKITVAESVHVGVKRQSRIVTRSIGGIPRDISIRWLTKHPALAAI